MHRLEPLSFLLSILVWEGADEVVAPAVLVDLARVPLDDDLVGPGAGASDFHWPRFFMADAYRQRLVSLC
ncbi:MAG TPA: hypothetical protein VJW23_09105 [Propionibacteriaceae bacterium]|nr:hypothetical protein [Propionibacteriaceae bacterium]